MSVAKKNNEYSLLEREFRVFQWGKEISTINFNEDLSVVKYKTLGIFDPLSFNSDKRVLTNHFYND
jgi:hypothetical protein